MAASSTQAWEDLYAPYAQDAGAALGVNPAIILSQWGLESGFGSNASTYVNNPGGIQSNGKPVVFATIGAFVSAFVSTIQNNFPGAVNAGGDVTSYVQGLTNSQGQTYYGTSATAQSYMAGITSAESPLINADPTVFNNLLDSGGSALGSPNVATTGASTGTSGTASPSTTGASPTAATSQCSGLTGFMTFSCWQNVFADVAVAGVGILVIVIALASGIVGQHPAATVTKFVRG